MKRQIDQIYSKVSSSVDEIQDVRSSVNRVMNGIKCAFMDIYNDEALEAVL